METADRFSLPDFVGAPAFASLVGILDDLDFQSSRVFEVKKRLAEALVSVAMHNPVTVQVIDPERVCTLGHGVDDGFNLT